MQSLIVTCRLHEIDPYDYLVDVLQRVGQHPASRRFLAGLEVAEFDASAAEVAGQVRSWLAGQGTPIGPYDSLIAAHAQALGVTLVTNNTRESSACRG